MAKESFKIGDKVKVIYNNNGSNIVKQAMNKIGMVKSIYNSPPVIIYVKFNEAIYGDLFAIGFFEDEIEHIVKVGEQLMLFELD